MSDSEARAISAFGLAWQYDEKFREQYNGYGIDLHGASGKDHNILPVPAVYLLDTDGKVLFQYVNPDYKVRIPAEVVLSAAQSIGQ